MRVKNLKPEQSTANRFAGLVLFFITIASPIVYAEDFDSLIGRARQQVVAGEYLDCLAIAQKAIMEAPQNYKGYYYAAFALYKTDKLDEARPFIEQAKTRAGAENVTNVDRLVQAIAYRRTALIEIKAGDAAIEEGLPGKAAAAYQRAWQAGTFDPSIGLKAAALFAERLGQPVSAAKILRQIVGEFPSSKPGEEAAKKLADLDPALKKAAQDYLQEALKTEGGQKKTLLLQAIDTDPNSPTPYAHLAEMAADDNDSNAMFAALKQMAKHGSLSEQYMGNYHYRKYRESESFQNFIGDVLGDESLRKLRTALAAEREEVSRKERATQRQREKEESGSKLVNNAIRRIVSKFAGSWQCKYNEKSVTVTGNLEINFNEQNYLLCYGDFGYRAPKSKILVSCKVARVSSVWLQKGSGRVKLTSQGEFESSYDEKFLKEQDDSHFGVIAIVEGEFNWKEADEHLERSWAVLALGREGRPILLLPDEDWQKSEVGTVREHNLHGELQRTIEVWFDRFGK